MVGMNRLVNCLVLVLALGLVVPAGAQTAIPPSGATAFKDTSSFKSPSGAKVAIIEFEDLECPLCAHVSPMVRDAMSHYKIPRVRYDFIIQGHMWSRSGAIYARYLQDKVSAEVEADCALGGRVGIAHTPTLVVATAHHWIEVTEPDQLYAAIDRAEAEA